MSSLGEISKKGIGREVKLVKRKESKLENCHFLALFFG